MFGVPLDVCGRALYEAISHYSRTQAGTAATLRDIHVVDMDPEAAAVLSLICEQLLEAEVSAAPWPVRGDTMSSEAEGATSRSMPEDSAEAEGATARNMPEDTNSTTGRSVPEDTAAAAASSKAEDSTAASFKAQHDAMAFFDKTTGSFSMFPEEDARRATTGEHEQQTLTYESTQQSFSLFEHDKKTNQNNNAGVKEMDQKEGKQWSPNGSSTPKSDQLEPSPDELIHQAVGGLINPEQDNESVAESKDSTKGGSPSQFSDTSKTASARGMSSPGQFVDTRGMSIPGQFGDTRGMSSPGQFGDTQHRETPILLGETRESLSEISNARGPVSPVVQSEENSPIPEHTTSIGRIRSTEVESPFKPIDQPDGGVASDCVKDKDLTVSDFSEETILKTVRSPKPTMSTADFLNKSFESLRQSPKPQQSLDGTPVQSPRIKELSRGSSRSERGSPRSDQCSLRSDRSSPRSSKGKDKSRTDSPQSLTMSPRVKDTDPPREPPLSPEVHEGRKSSATGSPTSLQGAGINRLEAGDSPRSTTSSEMSGSVTESSRKVYSQPAGGKMSWEVDRRTSLPGYDDTNTIVISYDFPAGEHKVSENTVLS